MFQLKLFFNVENCILPRNLDQSLVSFLKASAQNCSQEFYEELYDKSRSVIKSYTYSCYLPGARFEEEGIILKENNFSMYLSGWRIEDMMRFYNGFITMKHQKYPLNKNSMTLVSVTMQKLKEIQESEIVIKMQSPLIVRKHNAEDNTDQYFTYNEDGFEKAVTENIEFFINRQELKYIQTAGFSIMPIKAKKVIKVIFGRPVDGSIGIFKLTGTPELLNLLLLSGIGARRSSGNGKFEIIG